MHFSLFNSFCIPSTTEIYFTILLLYFTTLCAFLIVQLFLYTQYHRDLLHYPTPLLYYSLCISHCSTLSVYPVPQRFTSLSYSFTVLLSVHFSLFNSFCIPSTTEIYFTILLLYFTTLCAFLIVQLFLYTQYRRDLQHSLLTLLYLSSKNYKGSHQKLQGHPSKITRTPLKIYWAPLKNYKDISQNLLGLPPLKNYKGSPQKLQGHPSKITTVYTPQNSRSMYRVCLLCHSQYRDTPLPRKSLRITEALLQSPQPPPPPPSNKSPNPTI